MAPGGMPPLNVSVPSVSSATGAPIYTGPKYFAPPPQAQQTLQIGLVVVGLVVLILMTKKG